MAWNEPGGDNKDPWSGKGSNQGPPDLDEVVKKMQEKLGEFLAAEKAPKAQDPAVRSLHPDRPGSKG